MSRIGKKPIPVPDGAKVSVANRVINIEGKLGKLQYTHRPEIKVSVDEAKKQVFEALQIAPTFTRAQDLLLKLTEGSK